MEWPAGMRQRLDTALNVYNLLDAAQAFPAGGAAKWATAHPGAWKSLQNIVKLVREFDNDNPD